MLQSQGVRPLDPYRTLQLHPQAPRQLVTDAYWTLVERAKHGAGANGARDVTIEQLNDAYSLLADDARRRAYHEENGLPLPNTDPIHITVRKSGFFGSKRELVLSRPITHYEALRVDREADSEIIGHAFSLLAQQVGGPRPGDVFMRELLGDAHHTLSNPQLRAQYDGTLGHRTNGRSPKPSVARASTATGLTPGLHGSPDIPVAARGSSSAAHELKANGSRSMKKKKSEAADVARTTGPRPAPREKREPPTPPARHAAATVTTLEAAGPAPADAPAAAPGAAKAAPAPAVTTDPFAPVTAAAVDTASPVPVRERRGLFARRRAPEPGAPRPEKNGHKPRGAQAVVEAEVARLLSLREEPLDPPQPSAVTDQGEPAEDAGDESAGNVEAPAELLVVEGPQTGCRARLGENAVTIGCSRTADLVLNGSRSYIAPEHARVWQHGENYVLRQLDRQGMLINGEPMLLPMVILDDGDEIGIGGYRIRFSRRSSA